MMLKAVYSGFQSGSDLGGILAAVEKGIPTGGTMPKGWKTLDGSHPEYAEKYGAVEHLSSLYPPRTYQNVSKSDGTIRIASNHDSSGERCTFNAINQYNKPHFDVWVRDTSIYTTLETQTPKLAAKWIVDNKIQILNVAGNSELTAPGIEIWAKRYVSALIDEIRRIDNGEKSI